MTKNVPKGGDLTIVIYSRAFFREPAGEPFVAHSTPAAAALRPVLPAQFRTPLAPDGDASVERGIQIDFAYNEF